MSVCKSVVAVILAALFLAMAACDPDPFYVRVEFIEGIPDTGEAGTPLTLTGTVRPAFASNKDIAWSVKDPGDTGATISGDILFADIEGTAIIRATIANGIAIGKEYTQDFKIVFTAPKVITAMKVKTQPKLDYTAGETLDLSGIVVTLTYEDGTTEDIGYARFAPKGINASPAQGTTLVITAHNGKPIKLSAGSVTAETDNFEITPAIPVTGVKLDKTSLSLTAGDTETLTATIDPANATNKNVTWSSSNNAVATVTNGTVTAVAAGTATITVTTADGGFTATCAITVTAPAVPVTSVTVDPTILTLTVGGTATLTATVTPANATNNNVNWSSSNTAIATVNSTSGLVTTVTAVSAGTATITVTTAEGVKTATCTVTVTAPVVSIGIEMVPISTGTFSMGSPTTEPNRQINETQHTVTLSSFSMSKYQITQAQYRAVMGAGEDRTTTAYGKGDNYPIYYVNWYDALVFCNKLSMAEGLNPVYSIGGKTDPADWGTIPTAPNTTWNAAVMDRSKNGYRLPTESEWEYACRAGTTTVYNTGDTINDNTGWYTSNSGGKTHEVGLKTANAWGLYDMHGNVWEWCWDWYGSSYPSGAQTDPVGASSAAERVYRGGGWNDPAVYLRSAYRSFNSPYLRNYGLGFRLVRSSGVAPTVPVTGVSLNKTSTSLTVGGATETLIATVAPTNATNQAVTWSSSNTAVATVNNGTVTAVSAGTTTITVTTADGNKTAQCAVTVTVSVTGVTLNKSSTSLIVGATETLIATVVPTNATNQAVTWSSNNPSVATVDTNGKVTAVSAGTTTITVTTEDGGKTAMCTVTVTEAEARIGSTGYATLAAALTAAPTGTTMDNPTEIIVLRNITVSSGYTIAANKNIKLNVEAGQNITITASAGNFRLFSVSNADSSLTLGPTSGGGTLTLSGNNEDAQTNRQGVYISSSRSLTMNEGVTITGFKNSSSNSSSGVFIYNGTFTMKGGEISGNTANSSGGSGGVYVSSGTFTMSGGKISGNTGICGVYVSGGSATFTMSGGEISGNTGSGVSVNGGSATMSGGKISGNTQRGVSVSGLSATFTMSEGEISGNTGSGVWLSGSSATFTMSGGKISGNTGDYGGVNVNSGGTFTMNDGEISGNTASSIYYGGGGVYVSAGGGTFTMNGGEISGNTATSGSGGGVYVSSGTFTMRGGTIYGADAPSGHTPNTASSGAALYKNGGTAAYGGAYAPYGVITTTDKTLPPVSSSAVINITFAQISDASPDITVPPLSRTGTGYLKNTTLTIGSGYTNINWEITGTGISGGGESFTLDATDSRYNQIGDHHLTLTVYKDGVPYNKTIIFKIVD